ncbi:MAG TPA: helix-turn-helix domain-containing protein [Burkholderiales bacterium]|nr:helix-turn-helix domain-containing protein [Burkholderiales bacterium]
MEARRIGAKSRCGQSKRQHIVAVLARTQFDKRKAARILGISLASLYRKLGERRISNSPLQD